MIEFLLLFSLGFLAAALIGLLVAPVVYRRIVTLTERRMRASVPLSTAEVRAEKDFARAAYAAENARLAVDLREELDRLSVQIGKNAKLENVLAESKEKILSLQQQIELGQEEAGRLRSTIHAQDNELNTLRGELSTARREISEKKTEIVSLNDRINRLDGQLEEMKIDLATGDTEIENFKVQIQALRDERAMLREDLRARTAAARETEIKLKREENRIADLDQRLANTISTLSDKEELLEKRSQMIEELKAKQKEIASEARDASKALAEAERARVKLEKDISAQVPPAPSTQVRKAPAGRSKVARSVIKRQAKKANGASDSVPPRDIDELVDHLRIRQTALSELLKKAKSDKDDDALREEIAEIAALMVELTARREGRGSEIHTILSGASHSANPDGPMSLADRARQKLEAAAAHTSA